MSQIRVDENDKHTERCEGWCSHSYAGWLVSVAPGVLWYDVQDVGDYQGQVYGVGLYKGQVLLFEDYYGSCSGCGAWGEGGEPDNQAEVLEHSRQFQTADEAIAYVNEEWDGKDLWIAYPDLTQVRAAISEAANA